MGKLKKVYVDYNNENKCHYYSYFQVIDELPKVNDTFDDEIVTKIEEVSIDCENDNDCFDYDYYRVYTNEEDRYFLVCVNWKEKEDVIFDKLYSNIKSYIEKSSNDELKEEYIHYNAELNDKEDLINQMFESYCGCYTISELENIVKCWE